MTQQIRMGRLSQEIQREVNDIINKRVRDPRIKNITITGVDVTRDLQYATIYYSILSDLASDIEKAQKGLEKASKLIRGELGHRLNIYTTPNIIFVHDNSVKYANHIDELLNKIHSDDKNKK